MKALVLAELLKLHSTRTSRWLLLAMLPMVALTLVVSVPTAGNQHAAPLRLDDARLLAGTIGNCFGVPLVLMVLLGCMAFTQEFRYGTITSTYLTEPRRPRVLAAKWLSMGLTSIVISTATLIFAIPFSFALIRSRDGDTTIAGLFWQMIAADFVVMLAYAAIGVALGALLRNQIVAIVAVLVWMLGVEQLVLASWPGVGRWMPIGGAFSVMQLGPAIGLEGELLSVTVGGLVFAAYTAAAVALALLFTPKRDVL